MKKNHRTGRETRSPDAEKARKTQQYFLDFNWEGVYQKVAKALGFSYQKSDKKLIDNKKQLF